MEAFFLNILNKHALVASIKVKGNSLPYVTSELRAAIRTRDYLRAKANKTGSTYLRQAFNHVRNKVNRTLSELRIKYYTQKLDENKDDIKGTWKVLKQGQGTKSNNINKILCNDCEFIEQSKIADICNEHFVSIGERLAEGIPKSDESPTAHIEAANSSFVLQKITTSQTEKGLKKLINGKATGVHNIPNNILKDITFPITF